MNTVTWFWDVLSFLRLKVTFIMPFQNMWHCIVESNMCSYQTQKSLIIAAIDADNHFFEKKHTNYVQMIQVNIVLVMENCIRTGMKVKTTINTKIHV